MASIILGAQSNVWTQLSLPNPPAGSVPFVWTDNTTISIDPAGFNYNSTTQNLKVAGGLTMNSTIIVAAGATVIANSPVGIVGMPVGANVLSVLNNLVKAGDIIFTAINNNDATLTRVAASASADGIITIVGNAAATAQVGISFLVIKSA